jgi:branched-chain amino acid transport system ATP-binding protein
VAPLLARRLRPQGHLAALGGNRYREQADHGYILESGRLVMDSPASVLAQKKDLREFYLGLSPEGRTSFRTMKTYRGRKRWL